MDKFSTYIRRLLMVSLLISVTHHKDAAGNPFFTIGEKVNFSRENSSMSGVAGQPMTIYRLPDDVIPESYSLTMWPDLQDNFEFKGKVSIFVWVTQKTRTVYVHCKGLKIVSTEITGKKRQKYHPNLQVQPQNELCQLQLGSSEELQPQNRYTIHMSFEGKLEDNMIGFYRSHYRMENKTKWLASTQFEPTYARRAFPCFDEPRFKTEFTVVIGRYGHQRTISNMPLKQTSEPDPSLDNRVWDTFETTPRMPTYLLAFVVCEFNYVSTGPQRTFNVYARENAINETHYSLRQGEALLKAMENFTGIKYSLPKLDLVAIPDFQAGAMENWGLTTYRERYILYNPKVCPEKSKEIVTTVIAHELAHQWFGNYVTPTWWDCVWLNEAFATYIAHHIIHQMDQTWRMDELFVVDVLQNALFVDETDNYHAMTWPVKTPDEIKSVFDFIIYDKGGSVLRMLEHMVSPKTFKEALKNYLTIGHDENAGSVTPDILWTAFERQTYLDEVELPEDTNITTIMNKWVENRGYPLIKVMRVANKQYANIIIEQETYKSARSMKSDLHQEWVVPISYTNQTRSDFNNTLPIYWSFAHNKLELKDAVGANEWFLCNIQQTGYYRVKYDEEGWSLLVQQLRIEPGKVHCLNRAQLIDDAFSLAIDDQMSFDVAFQLVSTYLPLENDPIPLYAALRNLHYIYNKYESSDLSTNGLLKSFVTNAIEPHYQQLGFKSKDTDSHLLKTLRSFIVNFACNLDIEDCVSRATTEYILHAKDLQRIEPTVKGAVFCTLMNTKMQEIVWKGIWTLFNRSNIAFEKETILSAAGCTRNHTLLKKYLNKIVSDTDKDIRPQNQIYVLRSVFATETGVTAGLEFIKELLPVISTMSNDKLNTLKEIISYIESRVDTKEQLQLVETLMIELKNTSMTKYDELITALQLVDISSKNRISYNEKMIRAISDALRKLQPNSSTTLPATIESSTTTWSSGEVTTQEVNTTTIGPSSASTAMPSLIVSGIIASIVTMSCI